MPGRGPAPKTTRRRRTAPLRGEYQSAIGVGWQHGPIPKPPEGLMPASLVAWETWFRAWFAAHWTPDDLPGMRKVIRLYDATERGELQRSAELRMSCDNYGITPKGQQDRRWVAPRDAAPEVSKAPDDPYARLHVVGE